MATGLHLSTVGWSARNWCAMQQTSGNAPQHTLQILAGLRKWWDQKLDEEELRRALGELEHRGMVRAVAPQTFEATDPRPYRYRQHPPSDLTVAELEVWLETQAWQGWHAYAAGDEEGS